MSVLAYVIATMTSVLATSKEGNDKHIVLLYKRTLYSNPYSNAGELQRYNRIHNGQKRATASTGRTGANTSGQGVSSPLFEPYIQHPIQQKP